MPTLSANGIMIAYEQHGAGPHLLLITGLGYGGWFWHKVAPGLARQFTVTTFDNRGAGGSDKPAGPYTVDMLAADTAALLDGLGVGQTAVLGHSLGGFIAQRLVATRPELVSHLILASTATGGQQVIPPTAEALNVMLNREGDPLELIRRGIQVATAPGFAERYANIIQELIAYRLTNPVPPAQYGAQVMAGAATAQWSDDQIRAQLGGITVPTLILFGQHDQVTPPGNAGQLAAHIPQAQTVILPDAGHIFPLEDPAAAVAAISSFLTQTDDD